MALYLITYDLRKRRDYPPLYEALARLKATRLLQSVWLADLVGPASVVRDLLTPYLDADDGIAVIELKSTAQWATLRVNPSGLRWLQTKIPHHD
jgi:hypothetical protein